MATFELFVLDDRVTLKIKTQRQTWIVLSFQGISFVYCIPHCTGVSRFYSEVFHHAHRIGVVQLYQTMSHFFGEIGGRVCTRWVQIELQIPPTNHNIEVTKPFPRLAIVADSFPTHETVG